MFATNTSFNNLENVHVEKQSGLGKEGGEYSRSIDII